MNHRKACLTAALLTAVMMTAAPAVQAAESPEVSIIDITEDMLLFDVHILILNGNRLSVLDDLCGFSC